MVHESMYLVARSAKVQSRLHGSVVHKEYEKEQQKKGDYRSTKETWKARD